MRLFANLALYGLGLVGSALAKGLCCTDGCEVCNLEVCYWGYRGYCTNAIFNTCCAEDKRYKKPLTWEEHLAIMIV